MKMKSTLRILLVFTLIHTNLFAQNFWVPDANFRNTLKQLYWSCFTAQDSLITTCSQIQNESYLNVSNSSISSLDGVQYFTSLDTLKCNDNLLSSLPALPQTLTLVYCQNNQLTSLPALPSTLSSLACFNNYLSSLPTLPPTLLVLLCNDNQLTSLPTLPGTIIILDCFNNQLTNLPAIPAALIWFHCYYNQLTSLPALPSGLEELWCFGNQLASLPALPVSLINLKCQNNQLTSLPSLPVSLSYMQCQNNQLTSLPTIPGFTRYLDCSNNPINCFPKIAPRAVGSLPWQYINIVSTAIACIPNQNTFPLSILQSSQPLPFCSPVNNNCNYNFTSGYVYKDTNGNGIKDSLENGIPLPVYYSGNYGSWPDSAGFFNAISDTGNISFYLNAPYYTSTTPSSQTIHVASGSVDTLYFGLQPIPNINDLKLDLTSISFLRPGFKAKYKIHFQNVGTEIISNVHVKFLKPSSLTNLSSLPGMNAVNGDTLIWNFPILYPFQQGDILIQDSVFENVQLGDTANAFPGLNL